jgi:hypothetical protein
MATILGDHGFFAFGTFQSIFKRIHGAVATGRINILHADRLLLGGHSSSTGTKLVSRFRSQMLLVEQSIGQLCNNYGTRPAIEGAMDGFKIEP